MDVPPLTPDKRYIVVEGKLGPRLWRAANPHLSAGRRAELVADLMAARRAVRDAKGDPGELSQARARVQAAKVALGERGIPWWDDGAPDFNRRLVRNTPYAGWWDQVGRAARDAD